MSGTGRARDPGVGADRAAAPVRAPWHLLAAGAGCYAADALDFMMLALALPAISAQWQVTRAQAGLLGTAGMLGVGLSGWWLGGYADRHGRRRALILSVVLFAVLTALTSLAQSPVQIMLLRFGAGLGLGGVWGAVAALINESWPERTRARAIAWVLSAWPVGVSAAALLSSWLLPRFGWRGLFLCGALGLLPALYVYFGVRESPRWQRESVVAALPGEASIFSARWRRATLLGTLSAACGLTAYWGVNTWLPTFLQEQGLGAERRGLYLIVLNAGMFCGYPMLSLLAERFGKRRALMGSFLAAALLVPAYASLHNLQALLWCGPLLALWFAQTGIFGAYLPELYPTRLRARGAGFCFNVGRGLAALAPYGLGRLADGIGLAHAMAACGIAYMLATGAVYLMPEADAA